MPMHVSASPMFEKRNPFSHKNYQMENSQLVSVNQGKNQKTAKNSPASLAGEKRQSVLLDKKRFKHVSLSRLVKMETRQRVKITILQKQSTVKPNFQKNASLEI